ncbi:hypothetical protein VZT92_012333 [Zoarces viviparus]|uniref:Uncharacterized protein n=1 Tax=Zoarces viviparus TaxID=48416 RepID=A0AAW1F7E9_ZOAVI
MDGSLCGFRSRVSHLSSSSSGFNHMCSISGVALQRKAFGGDIGSKQAPVQQEQSFSSLGANTDTTLLETQDVLLDPLEGREARENQDQD